MSSTISSRIKEQNPLPGFRLLSLKTKTPNVALFQFSFKGGYIFDKKNTNHGVSIPHVITSLLDKGTTRKSKEVIRKLLAARGISISFGAGSHFVHGTLSCLSEDFPKAVALLTELFTEPSFPEAELELLRKKEIAEALERKHDTDARGRQAFRALLYPQNHPLYTPTIDEEVIAYKKVSRKEIVDFHKNYFGVGTLQGVWGGDIIPAYEKTVSEMFKSARNSKAEMFPTIPQALPRKATEQIVHIKDKANVSYFTGQSLSLTREHPDYYPLMLGVMILGGDFTARLMQEVREKRGLTYGVGASLGGFVADMQGFFGVRAGFAPEKLKEGEKVIKDEIARLVKHGVTEKELKARKENYLGSLVVGYASTAGLVEEILTDAENGKPKEFIDDFPKLINAITLKQVNAVLKNYIDPSKLAIVKAGSL